METVKWGIIGLGNIANKFAEALQIIDSADLYAVASRSNDKAEAFKDKHHAKVSYDNYSDLFIDKNVDAVYIAVPNVFHKELAIEALNHGKAVLLEKPATLNSFEMQEVIHAAKKNNVFFMEAMKYRFNPTIKHVVSLLKDHVIGDINYIHADQTFYSEPNDSYLYSKALGGGCLYDIGVYPLSLYQHLFHLPLKINTVRFDYNKTEVDTSFYLSAENHVHKQVQFYASIQSYSPRNFLISGSKGYISIPLFSNATSFTLVVEGQKENFEMKHPVNGLEYQIEASSLAILNKQLEHPLMSWQDSLEMAKLLDEIIALQ